MLARVTLFLFALFVTVLSAPAALDRDTLLENAQTAQALNAQFRTISRTDRCNGESQSISRSIPVVTTGGLSDGESACIDGQRAICTDSAWKLTRCPGTRKCFSLPSIRRPGTVSSSYPLHDTNTNRHFSLSGAPPNLTLSRSSRGQVEKAEYFQQTSQTQPSHFRL
jgi:hypothetical protein